MLSSNIYTLVALLASTTSAQRTTTATVLIPDWCVTQSAPTVTVVGQDRDLTTYSYSCSVDSSAIASASAKASSIEGEARSRASQLRASAENLYNPTGIPYNNDDHDKRSLNFLGKRDGTCYGWGSWEGCIPWEVTQGPSIWAVHYTVTGIVALDQECTFGAGGVASGVATCTANGRLDPGVWGNGDGPRTHTFVKNDIDRYWIRNTVAVTSGGGNGLAPATTRTLGSVSGAGASPGQTRAAQLNDQGTRSTGFAEQIPLPTGLMAMAVGAGGVLVAALAL